MKSLKISSYNPRWVQEFQIERERIAHILGPSAIRIEHYGSTAVPGLAAKPIIDIQVSIQQLQPIRLYAVPLTTLGYVHVPHADDAFCPFFHRPANGHTRIMSTLCKREEMRSARRSHSAITCASAAT